MCAAWQDHIYYYERAALLVRVTLRCYFEMFFQKGNERPFVASGTSDNPKHICDELLPVAIPSRWGPCLWHFLFKHLVFLRGFWRKIVFFSCAQRPKGVSLSEKAVTQIVLYKWKVKGDNFCLYSIKPNASKYGTVIPGWATELLLPWLWNSAVDLERNFFINS